MRNHMRWLVIVGITLVTSGCMNRRAWTTENDWYRPSAVAFSETQQVSDENIHLVAPAKEALAESLLIDTSTLAIELEQAAEMTGTDLVTPHDGHYYLVRGVYLKDTGRFWVGTSDDVLHVRHGNLGRNAVPMKKQALVILLQKRPTTVYVDCSMAE